MPLREAALTLRQSRGEAGETNWYPIGHFPYVPALWSAGGALIEDGHCGLRTPQALDTLKFMISLREANLLHPVAGDAGHGVGLLNHDLVAMTVASSRLLPQAPKAGVAPIPGKAGPVSMASEHVLVVFADKAAGKQAALTACLDALTGSAVTGGHAPALGSVPVRKSVAATVAAPDAMTRAYQAARFTPFLSAWAAAEFELNRHLDRAYRWTPPSQTSP